MRREIKNICNLIITCLIFLLFSCNNDSVNVEGKFEFITQYTTSIMVGGVVGVSERTFEIGEIFVGTDQGDETIKIRIAEHTYLNDDCPNSCCYDEFLDVPRDFLKFAE